jgi:Domain of unknown function (DUF4263)
LKQQRVRQKARNFRAPFVQQDAQKYAFLLERLTEMLRQEETYAESVWQEQILQIILLLNPKYIQAMEKVRIPGEGGAHRFLDVLLIDASGNVDVIEIKKPFNRSIVTQTVYRDNHIPLRELSGSVMQVEKYIYRLNRWGTRARGHSPKGMLLSCRQAFRSGSPIQAESSSPDGTRTSHRLSVKTSSLSVASIRASSTSLPTMI